MSEQKSCKSCREDLPWDSLVHYCRECYDELTAGIISREPAKLHSSGRVTKVERHSNVYNGPRGFRP